MLLIFYYNRDNYMKNKPKISYFNLRGCYNLYFQKKNKFIIILNIAKPPISLFA